MNLEAIQAIGDVKSAASAEPLSFASGTQMPNGAEFSELISSGIKNLNDSVVNSEVAIQDYILNKDVSTHDLMISLEKARFTMQLGVQVRNRLVEAYEQITRMQV